MRWKALAEIYKMHSIANLESNPKKRGADFYRNFTKSCRINKNYQIFAEKFFKIIVQICEI